MKIAVLGAGALGSVFAGLLGDAGNDVCAIRRSQEYIEAVNAKGLHVHGASGDRTVAVKASSDPAEVGPCELIILAVKARDVEVVAQSLDMLADENTLLMSIQNGLGVAERLARFFPAERLLTGVAERFGASFRGPGEVHHASMKSIRLGGAFNALTEEVEKVAEVWRDAGFSVQTYEDVSQLVWEKFICNVTYSGITALTHKTIGEVMSDESLWNIALGCGLEAYEVGKAKGVHFSFDDPVAYITAFGAPMPDARSSMLLDHLVKKKSEIDVINGAVPVVAREVGLQAPYNEVVSALILQKEANFL